MILGLEDNRVALKSYHLLWRWLFLVERRRLWSSLQHSVCVVDIQHVGSTAIPRIPAKPIIDILVIMNNFEQGATCVDQIETVGYTYCGENEQLRQYRFIKGKPQSYSLFVVESQSESLAEKIYFRNYLTQNAERAKAYGVLKQQLARQFPRDRVRYQQGKAAFIQQILKQAK